METSHCFLLSLFLCGAICEALWWPSAKQQNKKHCHWNVKIYTVEIIHEFNFLLLYVRMKPNISYQKKIKTLNCLCLFLQKLWLHSSALARNLPHNNQLAPNNCPNSSLNWIPHLMGRQLQHLFSIRAYLYRRGGI